MKVFITFLIALTAAAGVPAQWPRIPQTGVPRSANGQPNLAAPAPRSPSGTPDLSGIWEPNANRYVRNIAADIKPEDVPFQPWAKALYESRVNGDHSREDPDANC